MKKLLKHTWSSVFFPLDIYIWYYFAFIIAKSRNNIYNQSIYNLRLFRLRAVLTLLS